MRSINRKCYSSQEDGVILGVGMIILGYVEVEFELALEDRLIRWILDRFIRRIFIQDLLCNRHCARTYYVIGTEYSMLRQESVCPLRFYSLVRESDIQAIYK